jgi:hypothetical protein
MGGDPCHSSEIHSQHCSKLLPRGAGKMLSQVEVEFLRNPSRFGAKYSTSLRHRIRDKVNLLCSELALLERAGFVEAVKNRDNTVKFSSPSENTKQAPFLDRGAPVVRTHTLLANC